MGGFLGLVSYTSMAVQAQEYCDLYGLRFADIQDVLLDFPTLNEKLTQYAHLRRKAMQMLQGEKTETPKDEVDEPHHDSVEAADKLKQCPSHGPRKTQDERHFPHMSHAT